MKRFFKIFTVIAIISAIGFVAFADRHISSNDLPNDAKTFLNTHYSGISIYDCEIDDFNYDVDLSNGIDLKFDKKGKLLSIESDRGAIAKSVLNAILPANAINHLTSQNFIDRVDEVEFRRNTIVVDIDNYDDFEIRFKLDGTLK